MTRVIAIATSGVVAACLLCVAAWMVFSGGSEGREPDGVQIIAPAESADSEVEGSPAITVSAPFPTVTAPPQQIAVYVTGQVVNPGVYPVADGDRLDTVLQLAGGPTEDADLSRINLAAYVTDAAHYNIPRGGEPVGHNQAKGVGSTPDTAEPGAPGACLTPVNINTAGAECLETLPGIGGKRAVSIVAYREEEGPFRGPEAITDVPGIGDGIYRSIADMITVAAP